MILTIAASVCFILMIFIVFVVNSFMYIPSITTLITPSYPGDPETPVNADFVLTQNADEN